MFMKHPILYPLLYPLLFNNVLNNESEDSVMENCKGNYLPSDNIRVTSKYALEIQNGNVLKINLEKMLTNTINSLLKTSYDEKPNNYEIIEGWDIYLNSDEFNDDKNSKDNNEETYDQLNIHLFYLHNKDTIHTLFQSRANLKEKLELTQNSIKWEIRSDSNNNKIELQVFKEYEDDSGWNPICSRVESFNLPDNDNSYLWIYKTNELFNDSDIIILTTIGLLIYHYNENNKSISLNYFYYMDLSNYKKDATHYKEVFSKPTLPLPNYNSYKLCDGWISYVTENKSSLLKYGVGLLKFAIKEHNLELVDDIYNKCINYFKQDLRNNNTFLSIITSMMPLLNEYYPEYISKYSLELMMITDSPSYSINHQNINLHLCSFQHLKLVNLTRSILWFKYNIFLDELKDNHMTMYSILLVIESLIILLFLPIYLFTFYLLYKHDFINHTYGHGNFAILYFYLFENIPLRFSINIKTPTIAFMNPYIKFVNYPKDYNWFMELIIPQPSPFVDTINKNIYKTWNGEALINFKWNTFGKYYHYIIWIGHITLLISFNAAARIPQHEYVDIRKKLLITSIILGFFYLNFEVRQIIYDVNKWIRDIGNILGMR
jgi:hypothetical protein